MCISTVEIFSGKQLGTFENGTEEQLTLEEKSEEPTKYLQKIQKKGNLHFIICLLSIAVIEYKYIYSSVGT